MVAKTNRLGFTHNERYITLTIGDVGEAVPLTEFPLVLPSGLLGPPKSRESNGQLYISLKQPQ